MSNVSNYTFDNMSRIGLDPCCIDQLQFKIWVTQIICYKIILLLTVV